MDAPVLLLWNGRKKEGEYLEWQMFPWKRQQ
jgi:hypothetical protein